MKVEIGTEELENLKDEIVKGAIGQVVDILRTDLMKQMQEAVVKTVQEEIRVKIGTILEEVIGGTIHLTNQFGEKLPGKTYTLRELIINAGQNYFSQKVDSSGRDSEYSGGKTRAQYIIKEVAEQVVAGETKKEIDALIGEARGVVTTKLAEAFAQVLPKLTVKV